MGELKQTKGYAQLRGIVGGLERVKEAITNGKEVNQYLENDKIKKLQFSIKTSENNMIYVELKQFKTGNSLKNVYISKKDEETGKFETRPISFNERHRNFEDGWRIIGVSLKSNNDEHSKNFVPYDAIDYILENFNDGDSVFVNTEMSHSAGKDGKIYTNYEVKKMFVTHEPIDFKSSEFEEFCDFEETIIFDTSYPSEDGVIIQAYTVDYTLSPKPVEFLVKDKDKEVADFMSKELKTGDLLKVIGIVNNRAVYRFEKIESDSSDGSNILGRKTKREEQKTQPRYEKYIDFEEKNLQIIGLDVDTIKKGQYSQSDFEDDDSDVPF